MEASIDTRMPSGLLRCLMAAAGLMVSCAGLAQQPEERWYQIELIVFAWVEPIGVDAERWPPLEGLPDFNNAIRLRDRRFEFEPESLSEESPAEDEVAAPVDEALPAGPADSGPRFIAFQSVQAGDLTMAAEAARLRRDPRIEVLEHVAWRQPRSAASRWIYFSQSYPVELLEPIDSAAGAIPPVERDTTLAADAFEPGTPWRPQFEGIARLRVGDIIFVDVDFLFSHEQQLIRVTDSRRVLLLERQYVDHPLFGVIARVQRLQ